MVSVGHDIVLWIGRPLWKDEVILGDLGRIT